MVLNIALSIFDHVQDLKKILKKRTDWYERDRAKTILMLAAGQIVQVVDKHQDLCREAM